MTGDATLDWFWEGNVVAAVAKHLESHGWEIVSMADTFSRQQGVDLHARRDGRDLLVEAKGYPSKGYRDPLRAHERKPTNPSVQAQHWYSHALLKVVRLQTDFPEATIAMAFPDFPRYRALFDQTHVGLSKLGVTYIAVDETGTVTFWGMK